MIEATITGDEAVLARFERLPNDIRQALADSMRAQWFRLQAAVVTGKLSGDPLHRRTGVLASSINVGGPDTATEFVDGPTEIVGRVGTKVRYGKVHEEGGTFEIPAYTRKSSTVFGREVAAFEAQVRAHKVTFPQRSFLRSTLDEMRQSILDELHASIAKVTSES